MADRRVLRIQKRLGALAADLAAHEQARDRLYAERNALYVEAVGLGVKQVDVASWAGSTPVAVAQALRKLRKQG